MRLYHGIIAKRLIWLLLSKRQKGFLLRDVMADNTFVIECPGKEEGPLLGIYEHG